MQPRFFSKVMCGVFGIAQENWVAQDIFDALTVLQHRGQDAAGIATCDSTKKLHLRKGNGLVRDVVHTRHMKNLHGNMGIGHVRYPTAGCYTDAEAQPFYVNSPFGIVLAHNGNLTNADDLRAELTDNKRYLATNSDSEVLLNVFAHELSEASKDIIPMKEEIFTAIEKTMARIRGSYAVVAIVANAGLIAFRDPNGIRPLSIGKRRGAYAFSSEPVPFFPLGFEHLGDVGPGESCFVDTSRELSRKQCHPSPLLSPCIFEHVYMARPDSTLDNISVHKARLRMGELLAKTVAEKMDINEIDVVIPIPESSRNAAMELALTLNKKYREGFVKNRYIGRTFIMPAQTKRKKSVEYKLSTIELEFRGKNVLLVDDSIVRGTTSKEIIQMARNAGAKKVYFASAAPPVRYPNVYGIDMPTRGELIAHGITEDEIGKIIGADCMIYQKLPDLIAACQTGNPDITRFDTSCFDGDYVTGDIDEAYLQQIESARGKARGEEEGSNPITLL